MIRMTAGEKSALEKLAKIIPKLSDKKKEYFLGVIDGMGIASDRNEQRPRKSTDESKQAS